nr:Chain C, 8-meric Peptide P5e [Gallus gallus]4G43_F Chain F, 8-meric Peptide P5e [Gallus gallus]
IDWFEGKE